MNDQKDTVIITGSSGFIGSALAQRLSEKFRIVGLDQGIPQQKIDGVDYYALNMSSPAEVENTIQEITDKHGKKIASVVHLVAYYNFDGKESSKYKEITVNGTKSLLSALKKHSETDQFIFSSTMLVHAPSVGRKVTEEDPLRPGWAYPQSKVDAEDVIHETRGNISALNLRIAGVYEDTCHSIPISNHIARIYENQFSSILFPGDADHGQTFLHLQDLIDAIELAVEKRQSLPEEITMLLGEDQVMPYRELQERIGELTHNLRWPTVRVPEFFARFGATLLGYLPFIRDPFIKPWMIQYADDNYVLDLSRPAQYLGWKPKHSLENALPIMINDLKSNPEKWYAKNKLKKPPLRTITPVSNPEQRVYWAGAILNIFLAIWLISNPFTLGPMNAFEYWNDLITGLLVFFISALSMLPAFRNYRWVNVILGTWLMLAPLAFWSRSPAMYSNDTLFGALIILLAGFTPSSSDNKDEVPSGWSYNPSSWNQRLPIMLLAFIGFLLARYLAAFQLGHISEVWEPFFGNGSARILKSDISKAFPVSDGGLGAFSYITDVLSAAIGDRNRWRTMPWMVILFGIFIVPTGATSITLVMLQPIAVNAWCTICLITAFIMLVMVPPAVDEVVATIQFLRRSVKSGRPFWRTFWLGGEDVVEPEYVRAEAPQGSHLNIIMSVVVGVWLLFVPELYNIEGAAANNIYIVAALVITCAVIAYADVARIMRIFNVPLGAWLCISPWFIGDMTARQSLFVVAGALALILFSVPRGKVVEHFGSFDPWVHFNISQLVEWFQEKRHLNKRIKV